MFERYAPQHYARDFVEVRGDSAQLVNFMATALGHKPLMDDWIAPDRLPALREVCARYGLAVEAESMFVMVDKEKVPARVLGRETITTTSAFGVPVDAQPPPEGWSSLGARVHVFISREPDRLRHGMWYPIIIRDRMFWPPRADLLAYGHHLGYPPCCIAFFQRYNNWRRYSFLWEIRKRSTTLHPLCNPLGKDRTYSYIYHMPCSFSCAATVERVTALRADIEQHEPGLAAVIDRHLRLPALVFRERKIYFFEGEASEYRIDYTAWAFEGGEPQADVLGAWLAEGDAVEIEPTRARVRVLRGGRELGAVTCSAEGFAPEIPFIAQFL